MYSVLSHKQLCLHTLPCYTSLTHAAFLKEAVGRQTQAQHLVCISRRFMNYCTLLGHYRRFVWRAGTQEQHGWIMITDMPSLILPDVCCQLKAPSSPGRYLAILV